jgi:hypothetical protein
MANIWTEWRFWWRAALIASAVWFGMMVIAAQISHDFRWFPNAYRNNYDFGPAGITAFVGIAVIFAICLGVPWVASSLSAGAGGKSR